MRKLVIISLALLMISGLWAEITWSGSARLRPRIDMKDYGDFPVYDSALDDYKESQTDIYWWYRAYLDMLADIGGGWMFKAQLSAFGPANFTKFGAGSLPHSAAYGSASRPAMLFNQLYYGYKGEQFGFFGGLVPISGINNPGMDIHFYPDMVVDIPWVLFNISAATGFTGYYDLGFAKLNGFFTFDNEVLNTVEYEVGEKAELSETKSIGLDATLMVGPAWVQPVLIKTMGEDVMWSPMTVGVNAGMKVMENYGLSGGFFSTTQDEEDGLFGKYSGTLFRIKATGPDPLGMGSFAIWYDMATMDFDTMDYENDLTYLWAHWNIVVYKSEQGSVAIKPTFRFLTDEIADNYDFTRTRFEINTEIKFK